MQWIKVHRKAIIGLVGAGATFAVTTGIASQYQWIGAVVAVLTALGVYRVPNVPAAREAAKK